MGCVGSTGWVKVHTPCSMHFPLNLVSLVAGLGVLSMHGLMFGCVLDAGVQG